MIFDIVILLVRKFEFMLWEKIVGLAVTHNLGAELTNEKPTCIFDNAAAKHQKQKHTAARMTMQYRCDVLCVTLLWTRENFHLFIFVRI